MAGRASVVEPGRALPPGYPHAHASEQARVLAERGMILRVQVGSGVHGTSISGQDDRDEMGLCLEPPEYVTGLARVPAGTGATSATVPFEQYERHTAWDRSSGLASRSGGGDLDVIIYSARKWCRLALAGNPTVLLPLFVPEEVIFRNEAGAELVAMHGYDTKYAMHALRLGIQGVELLTTGHITLPVPAPPRDYLRAIRRGEVPLADVIAAIDEADADLLRLRSSAAVPPQPDRAWVDGWLHRSYLGYWSRLRGLTIDA